MGVELKSDQKVFGLSNIVSDISDKLHILYSSSLRRDICKIAQTYIKLQRSVNGEKF